MTKELSKQLCELCGIKRKKISLQQNCDKTCKYWNKTDTYDPCKRGDNICPEHIKYIYPDFGQPENFVKLWELKLIDGTALTAILSNVFYPFYERQQYLSYLVEYLEREPISAIVDGGEELKEQFKQSIREAGWKYE